MKVFWESHDPTQGDRQGHDIGPQYRSVIFTSTPEQLEEARKSLDDYQAVLGKNRTITTVIREVTDFYLAKEDHQQYLHKNPDGP